MKTNKHLPDLSLSKIWDKLHKAEDSVTELESNLGGYSFFSNPEVVYTVANKIPYEDENGSYIFAESDTGREMLANTATYTKNVVEGNFYRIAGADSVNPFKGKVDLVELTLATATAAEITQGFTAWVNGQLVTGTRPSPVKQLSGTVQGYLKAGGTATGYVTFSTPFDKTPTVSMVHISPSNSSKYYCSVSNVSINGFTWTMGGQSYGTDYVNFKWTASV